MRDNKSEQAIELKQNLWIKIFKSKSLMLFAGLVLAIILLLSLLPLFFENSALKFQIEQKISQIFEADFSINGRVKIKFLPLPAVVAEDILLQNYKFKPAKKEPEAKNPATPKDALKTDAQSERIYNFYAKSLSMRLPILNLFGGKSLGKIIFEDAFLQSYYIQNQQDVKDDKFTKILARFTKKSSEEKKLDSGFSAKLFAISGLDVSLLPIFEVKNTVAIFYDQFSRQKEISAINAEAKISKEKISVSGNFNNETFTNNFKFLVKFNSKSNHSDSLLEVTSPILNLHITGKFISENRGILASDFSGKIAAEIFELKSFYKSYISNNSVIFNKLKYSAKPIKISADIENKSQEISLSNILINSSLLNGGGTIDLSFSDQIPLIDIVLDLENLDLDSVWSGGAVPLAENQDQAEAATTTNQSSDNSNQENQASANDFNIDFNFINQIKDFDLSSEITVKNAKYLAGEITDIDLYMTVSRRGEILVLPIIFKVPGEGIFRINGVLDNSAQLPKFVGKFDGNGKVLGDILKWLKVESPNLKFENLKNYSVYSDILLLPNSANLDNFYLNLNDGGNEFLGEIKIENGDKNNNIKTRFEISNFNIDDYFLTSGQNIYFAPGSLLKKLLWLNDISSSNELDLKFDQLVYKGENFSDQSLKLKFRRGYFEIADLNLKSATSDLNGGLTVDISGASQKFVMNFSSNNFQYQTPQSNNLAAKNTKQETAIADFDKSKKYNFFDQFFSLPSLQGFDGVVMLNFENLRLDDLEIKKLKLGGKITDGNIIDSQLTSDLYGGSLSYRGVIGLKIDKIINGNLSFSNVDLQSLLPDLIDVKNISGVANIAASVTASAGNKNDFIKKLNSEIKFSTNSPSLAGYGLNDLIRKMFVMSNYRQELKEPEKILFNSQSVTTFDQANGAIQINGGNDGKLRINLSAPAVNGILSGKIDASNSAIDALFSATFLTGNRQKQIPINIATSIKGTISAPQQSTNIDQARQYLGLPKLFQQDVGELNLDTNNVVKSDVASPASSAAQDQNKPTVDAQASAIEQSKIITNDVKKEEVNSPNSVVPITTEQAAPTQ